MIILGEFAQSAYLKYLLWVFQMKILGLVGTYIKEKLIQIVAIRRFNCLFLSFSRCAPIAWPSNGDF